MTTFLRLSVFIAAVVSLAACAGDRSDRALPTLMVEHHQHPAQIPAGQLFASPLKSADYLLSWIEPSETGHVLLASTVIDGAPSSPLTVASGADWFVNWADFPSILAVSDSVWYAHFLKKSGEATFAYHVMVTHTTDGGATWSAPLRMHTDDSNTEHGFASMTSLDDDSALVIWLDGRQGAGENHQGHGPMSLRGGTIGSDGHVEDRYEIDDRVCDCCQTALVRTNDGTLVAYRDRTPDEVRDIALRRYHDGEWSEPYLLHDDGWQIAGCPVNGPALSADGQHVVAAWFTAAQGEPRVQVKVSDSNGRTFSPPIRIDGGQPLGRVDTAIIDERFAVVTWLEEADGHAAIQAALVDIPSRSVSDRVVLGSTTQARTSGFPRMAASGGSVLVTWLEVADGAREGAARLTLLQVNRY